MDEKLYKNNKNKGPTEGINARKQVGRYKVKLK